MKKPCLFLLLCFLSTHSYAQQAPAFGFSVHAGTFAFPSRKSEPGFNHAVDYSYVINRINAGESYALGIWHSFPLGARLRLSSELHLRSIRYFKEFRRLKNLLVMSNIIPFKISKTGYVTELGLALPVKLHYKVKKSSKFSISAGTGISYLITTDYKFKTFSQFEGFPADADTYYAKNRGWQNTNITIQLNLGLYYQLDPNSNIGLAYTHENSKGVYEERHIDLDTQTFLFNSEDFRPNMNSFSVSLRHNILD